MNGLYLLRIGVRIKSQSQGIGRQLMNYLLEEHPLHILTLDVSTDNQRANTFYKSFGLQATNIYLSMPDEVEFAFFESMIDTKGGKIKSNYERELDEFNKITEDGE